MVRQMDGIRSGRCIDTDSEDLQPGGGTQVFPCIKRWYQFLSFGDGHNAPRGSMYTSIPSHIVRQIHNLGHEQHQFMCLGVLGRGDNDEVPWDPANAVEPMAKSFTRNSSDSSEWGDLAQWNGELIVTTACSNEGGVVEWVFVPFIVEDEIAEENNTTSPSTGDQNNGSKEGTSHAFRRYNTMCERTEGDNIREDICGVDDEGEPDASCDGNLHPAAFES
jgi:hypothetical protein